MSFWIFSDFDFDYIEHMKREEMYVIYAFANFILNKYNDIDDDLNNETSFSQLISIISY